MNKEGVSPLGLYSNPRRKIKIKTTMGDLLRALNSELRVGEQGLVPFIVVDMMERGLLKFVNPPARKNAEGERVN
jgi:hypothetical protein